MSKEGQHIPQLRFSEYSGDWRSKQLQELTSYVDYRGRGPIKSDDGIFLVTAKNIKKGFIDYECSKEYVPYENIDLVMSKGLPMQGDVLFTTEAPLGNVAQVNDKNIALAQRVIKFRGKDELSNEYLLYYMLSFQYQRLIVRLAIGSTVLGISGKELHRTIISYPSLPEQQKIADFLTIVDKKIQALEKKKALLEQYKKGLMQKIFKQEIRFKQEDGSDYPEWEEKRFENLYNFAKSNSLSRDKLNYESGEIKNIHYGDIHSKFRPRFSINDESVPFINTDISLSNYEKIDFVGKGDLIIADASEDYNDIGKAIEIVSTGNQNVLAGLHTFLAKIVSDKVVVGFMSHYINCWKYRYQVMRIAQGTKVLSLSKGRVLKLKIDLPSIAEQTQIANLLTSLDDKIIRVTNQIDKMKLWKKGLLQQMFV